MAAALRAGYVFDDSSTSQTTHSLTAPSSRPDGDVIVIALSYPGGTNQTITWPSGFVEPTNGRNDLSTSRGIAMATKVASGESGNYTVVLGTASVLSYFVGSVSDADTGTRVDDCDQADSAANTDGPGGTSALHTFPQNTTSVDGDFVLYGSMVLGVAPSNWTAPSGVTELGEVATGAGSGNLTMMLAHETTAPAAGTVPSRTFTSANTTSTMPLISLAIKAATAVTVVPGTVTATQWSDWHGVVEHEFTGGTGTSTATVLISTDNVSYATASTLRVDYDYVSSPKTVTAYIVDLFSAANALTGEQYWVKFDWGGGVVSSTATFTTLPRRPLISSMYEASRVTPTNFWYGNPNAPTSSTNTVAEIASSNYVIFSRDGSDQSYIGSIKAIHPDGRNYRALQYFMLNEIECNPSTKTVIVPALRNTVIGRDWTGSAAGTDPLHASAATIVAYIDAQTSWFIYKATGYDPPGAEGPGDGTQTKANRLMAQDGDKVIMNPGASGWIEYQKLLLLRHTMERHSFGPSGYGIVANDTNDLRRFIGFFADNDDPNIRPAGANTREYGTNSDTYSDDVRDQNLALRSLGLYLMGNVLSPAETTINHANLLRTRKVAASLDGVMLERIAKTWSSTEEEYISATQWKIDLDNALLIAGGVNTPDIMYIAQVYDSSKEMTFDGPVRTGTAQAGTSTTITLDAGASSTNDLYFNLSIEITSGTGSGQRRIISDYVGSTKVATVSSAWTTNPNATSVFRIVGLDLVAFGFSHVSYLMTVPANDTQFAFRAKSGASAGSLRYRIMDDAHFAEASWNYNRGQPTGAATFLAGQTAVGGGGVTTPDGIWVRTFLRGDGTTTTYYLNVSASTRESNVAGVGQMTAKEWAAVVVPGAGGGGRKRIIRRGTRRGMVMAT